VRHFFSRRTPDFTSVLLVESGSRQLLDDLIPGLYELYGDRLHIDLLTCYAGEPKGFRLDRGAVYRVTDYPATADRRRLLAQLAGAGYAIVGIVCSGEPILAKWKWVIAARLPAKLFLLNENGDYFWFDYSNWRTIRHFLAFRAGLTGASGIRTVARLLLFPLALLYLLLFAAVVHLRRKLRPASPTV